jgi:hypothetical protein
LDDWGPLPRTQDGYGYCLVAIGHFSKIAIVLPIIQINYQAAIHFMKKVFECLGSYNKMLLDRASYFRTKHIASWAKNKEIEVHIANATHSEANGCCERFIRTFGQSLVKCGARSHNWYNYLLEVILGYNESYHSSIGCTPSFCHNRTKNMNSTKYQEVWEK